MVLGWFSLVKAILEGAINPSLLQVVEQVRKGTLDFTLLKPADAQFLVSTSRSEPWMVTDALVAFAIFGWAFSRLGRWPGAWELFLGVAMLLVAVLAIYSLSILVIAVSFFVIRIDNLTYLLTSIFDAARWPVTVFSVVRRAGFSTFVIPLALMTTFPAMALLGTLRTGTFLLSLAGTVLFAAAARGVWQASLGRYASASS